MSLPIAARAWLLFASVALSALCVSHALAVPVAAPAEVSATSAPPSLASHFSEDRDNYFISRIPYVTGDGNASVKFQLSTNFELYPNTTPIAAYLGYTQKSLWHLWDLKQSSPLQDTNYNPSISIAFRSGDGRGERPRGTPGFHFYWARLIGEHESNGTAGVTSRSWNRVSAAARLGVFFTERLYLIVQPKVWWPLVSSSLEAGGGGNPRLLEFVGYGQLGVEIGLDGSGEGKRYAVWAAGAILRKGTNSIGSGEFWLRWRPPLRALAASIYVQYYGGYTETLLTYDRFSSSLRVGLALDDFLPAAVNAPDKR